MNSNLIFRGKTSKNSDWKQLNLINFATDPTNFDTTFLEGEIIPASIGQSLGITDSKNETVYTNNVYKSTISRHEMKWLVAFVDFSFVIFRINAGGAIIGPAVAVVSRDSFKDRECIGNTFDNPELVTKGWLE